MSSILIVMVDQLNGTLFPDDPAHAETLEASRAIAKDRWDHDRFDAEVRQSHARHVV